MTDDANGQRVAVGERGVADDLEALVGGATAVALHTLPLRLGLFAGIVAGILAGFAAEHWHSRKDAS